MWVLVPLALLALPASRAIKCGGTFEVSPDQMVNVRSPVHSKGNYKKGLDCTYIYTCPDYRASLQLTCPLFDVSGTGECKKKSDYLMVTDKQTLYLKFCGDTKPERTYMTGGPYLELKFKTNRDKLSGQGFKCTVKCVLDLTYTTTIPTKTLPVKAAAAAKAPVKQNDPPAFVPKKGYNCTCGEVRSDRLIGGAEADMKAHPWHVAIMSRTGTIPECSGVTINDRHVLTAASCAANPNLQVHFGEHDVTQVSRIIIRDVSNVNTRGDLVVLTLSRPINLGSMYAIQPVCLPDVSTDFTSKTARVTGWGATSSTGNWAVALQELELTIANDAQCSTMTSDAALLCARNSGSDSLCQRDSGAPLVVKHQGKNVLVGVATSRTDCSRPLLFTDIQKQLSWIKSATTAGVPCYNPDNPIVIPTVPTSLQCSCGIPRSPNAQTISHINNLPWTVALIDKTKQNEPLCSGTITTSLTVLTAGDCILSDINNLQVRFNAQDINSFSLSRYINREVASVTYNNDNTLALITLTIPISITRWDGVLPACLPKQDETFNLYYAYHSGYESTVVERTRGYWHFCFGSNICFKPTQSKGFCGTGKGGPIVSKKGSRIVLVGIALSDRGCYDVLQMAVPVSTQLSWLTGATSAAAKSCAN